MADRYALGALVPLTFNVTDADGQLADAGAVTLTVTRPDGSTTSPTLDHPSVGVYQYDLQTPIPGRYTARFVATGANAGSTEDVFDVTAAALGHVTVVDVSDYLRDGAAAWTTQELAETLAAEQAAQAARCRIDPYTADLREAVLRRVQRNLALRPLPLAVLQGDAEAGSSTVLPGADPEVRRLEGPYRRRRVG